MKKGGIIVIGVTLNGQGKTVAVIDANMRTRGRLIKAPAGAIVSFNATPAADCEFEYYDPIHISGGRIFDRSIQLDSPGDRGLYRAWFDCNGESDGGGDDDDGGGGDDDCRVCDPLPARSTEEY